MVTVKAESAKIFSHSERESWVGSHGELCENIAEVVARGIALGRKEGPELAGSLISKQLKKADGVEN